ncbi:MAG: hypothetical protein A2653_02910 [Candidatus Zambryskibacteria bacterium RIFCSPHIGHO2_01_FULL_43_25]|uniref:ABC transporter substrate-binding protein n=1 Tax=Candidatus Zambryskibacteria bacterium RIFCSPLOWO2_01_FULL_45_21 TaxID=1802761 RepID=A0A1G2U094_9BACT|nr:MAG: hypothetical protein A2653_02910 [Candidatus Zambryskibacteria bacterium RIFCSPHIGHO2_01_FULL_43_25]OHB00930.1 MAG: hypothetical protein A3E94_00110 [Candidatus Zambryskibacteria bacterium RIFCSPHIGHO2_12_FULL_44_12b]OHB02958.1 MAG: hypothetical protein A3B14_00755 [Candidatus Zambryskibacteria bacterium RIFCSPLOWO2_01_FULL_45_21]
MSKFQIGLLVVFGVFIAIGVAFFALSKGGGGQTTSNVVIWGTMSRGVFSQSFSKLPISKDDTFKVSYVEKPAESFDEDLLEALASGGGPDLIVISQDLIIKYRNKIFPIPYQTISERDFKSSFVEEAEMFLMSDGIVALPLTIDPLVMYWNRDIFTNAGISTPPLYWDEFFDLTKKLTIRAGALNLERSTVAMGEFSNIQNAKEILTTLIFQAGNPIVEWQYNKFVSTLSDRRGEPISPANSALTFYTEFSNPTKAFYSWNRSLPDAQTSFVAGDLAVYFGFASELDYVRRKNPNLNFDVSIMPQSRNSGRNTTFGQLYGLAIIKNSKNIAGAYQIARALTTRESVAAFVENLKLPPPRRDLLAELPSDQFLSVFYKSALWARGWHDPDPEETEVLFREMIESITGGRVRQEQAIADTHGRINLLLEGK